MVLDKQYLFIIGSPRSGTTWLQLMLGAHPAVCTTVELTPFLYTSRWIFRWNKEAEDIREDRWHIGLPMVWTEAEFYGFLHEFLERVYSPVLKTNPQATHVLDKHPTNAAFVEEIDRLIPNSRFIHVIRDGRDVAASMVAAKQQMGFGTGTVPESAAAWKEHVEWGRKAGQFDGRYLELRYETMMIDPQATLKAVYDFCGLANTPDQIAETVQQHTFEKVKADRVSPVEGVALPKNFYRKGKVGSWQQDLPPVQRYLFDEIAGDLLVELGYAEKGWWAETAVQKYLLPLQIAFSTRQRLRQTVKKSTRRILKPATQSA
jgi:hypothetical protein